jgi:N6-adenosine-specific RNA methylase IME4
MARKGGDRRVTVLAPVTQFSTIVADPPWQYGNTATRGAAEDHYPTMSIDELCSLPVNEWAADQAHLYLWTTNGFLREAFNVMDAWGFTYKTTLVWVKPQLGLGNYFRSASEYVLFGNRGGLMVRDSNQPNWFEAPRGRHSKKPGSFFDLVEKVSYPPYLEMFARQRRLDEHWDYWGNEA